MTRRRVVLSWAYGADSTALLLRWIHEPATRPCALRDLLVITAMTGDEWPATGRLVAEHILPRLRAHPAVEYFFVAAPAGPREKEARGFQAAWHTVAQPVCTPKGAAEQLALPLNWARAA
jgi:hypothetical protein